MTNALQLNQSTVVGGLGTQAYTLTTTGLYTLSCESFLPYLPIGSPAQSAMASAASSNITLVADSSGSLNSTYFTFNSANDAFGYYVWYNINSAGVDPAVAGRTGIQVAGATGATAATLATATAAAINTATALQSSPPSYVTAAVASSTHVVITNIQYGKCTGAADGTAATGFTFVNTAGSYGTPEKSGLVITLKQNSTVLTVSSFATHTQPILSASARISGTAADVISVVLTSLSGADNASNAVKSVVNLYAGY